MNEIANSGDEPVAGAGLREETGEETPHLGYLPRHDRDTPSPGLGTTARLGRHDTATSVRRWGFELAGREDTAVVLVHDLGTTPLGLERVAAVVAEAGLHVSVPVLPGHEDFARPRNLDDLTPPRLLGAVDDAVATCARRHSRVLLAGFGLGGSLALTVAARVDTTSGLPLGRADAIALVSTPFAVHRRRRALAWLSRTAIGSIPGPAPDCKSPEGDEVRLPAWPGHLSHLPGDVEKLGARSAGDVRVPGIVFHAREDHLVPPADARRLVRAIGSDASELVWLERSFHQIWLDYDARLVGERIARFAQAIGGQHASVPVGGSGSSPLPVS